MKHYDVFGVGNALVDILVPIEDKFLHDQKLDKGIMTLVDSEKQGELLSVLHDKHEELRSGGSAANTMIALANSGGTGVYIGKVGDDSYGEFYKKDMEDAGIVFEVNPVEKGQTGTCLVMTSPDAERTMLTNLAISVALDEHDVDVDRLQKSHIAYVEGYLWDGDSTKRASIKAMEEAKKAGIKVAFTYSDPFCVNRSREDFLKISKEYLDIAFCNWEEARSLTQIEDKNEALKFLSDLCPLVFMTDSENGAFVADKGKVTHVPGFPVEKLLDTTGAGDSFAAGVLYGLTHDYSVDKAARWGNYVASRMIQEIGARLKVRLMGRQEDILSQSY